MPYLLAIRNTARQIIMLTPNIETGKTVSEYDQDIPQSHTADQPTVIGGQNSLLMHVHL